MEYTQVWISGKVTHRENSALKQLLRAAKEAEFADFQQKFHKLAMEKLEKKWDELQGELLYINERGTT